MDPVITAAIIGGLSTVGAAIAGAVIGRSEVIDRLFRRSRYPNLIGTKWESKWTEKDSENNEKELKELFEITWQRRDKVSGVITSEAFPDMKWTIEGDYNERFLRLFWQPSWDSPNQFFLDYGCYFFERNGDGSFVGFAIGYNSETNKVEVHEHSVRKIA